MTLTHNLCLEHIARKIAGRSKTISPNRLVLDSTNLAVVLRNIATATRKIWRQRHQSIAAKSDGERASERHGGLAGIALVFQRRKLFLAVLAT
ncbi:hypothetical protein N183_15415 [Sinorhizobium sp. Sb3]|nr:hypothetical protein N183_15415 [Sinorhizobium sp. Sb3]